MFPKPRDPTQWCHGAWPRHKARSWPFFPIFASDWKPVATGQKGEAHEIPTRFAIDTLSSPRVIAGHSRTKDGVASLAYDPATHDEAQRVTYVRSWPLRGLMDARVKPAHDAECVGSLYRRTKPTMSLTAFMVSAASAWARAEPSARTES